MQYQVDNDAVASGLHVFGSNRLPNWLAEQNISLAFTTYQAGKLLLLGHSQNRLQLFERTFSRCMGLCGDDQNLWLSSEFQLWKLQNMLPTDEWHDGADRLFVPHLGHTTGELDIHDVAIDGQNRLYFISTLFSCLAMLSDRASFQPVWRPPWISRLAAEDRCHLNGLAMEHGRPRYVTACSQSDVAEGWRDCRSDGGCVLDMTSGEIILQNLSMPHSPRVYDGKLWLLNSGDGHFGCVDLKAARFEAVTFCPGYARGLSFAGNFAIVGLSKPRQEKTFAGLPLHDNLAQRGMAPRCGLQVIDLQGGEIVHTLHVEGPVAELYDVVVLPGVTRPKALGFKTDEIRHNVWFDHDGKRSHWSTKG